MLPTITLFNIEIPMYNLCFLVGLLVGTVMVFVKRRTFGISKWDLMQALAAAFIGIVCGGKFVYALGQIVMHGSEPGFWTVDGWKSMFEGNVFYGSFIGAVGLVLLFAKRRQVPLDKLTGLMTYFIPTCHIMARLGCLCADCCYGIEVKHMFTVPSTAYAEPRLPWPLLEMGLNLLILLAFLLWRPERRRPGALFPLYLIMYAAGRFTLDFFRAIETRGPYLFYSISLTQWIALAMVIAASVTLYKMHKSSEQAPRRLVAVPQ